MLENKQAFFSVVIPCYNGEEYIESAISSLEHQTFKNFEIIVVNDGSTDNSAKILETLSQRISSLTIIQQENKGLPAARNAAIKKMTAKWLVLLDADDIFLPDRLQYLYQLIQKNTSTKFLFHDSYRINNKTEREDLTYIHRKYFYDDLKLFVRDSIDNDNYIIDAKIWQFLLCNYTCMIPITLCMSKELVDSLEGPFDEELKVGEDVDFCVRCLKELDHIIYSDSPLTEYRVHDGSMTHSENYIFRMVDYYNISKKKYFHSLTDDYKNRFLKKTSNHFLTVSYTYRKKGKHFLAINYAIKSFFMNTSMHGLLAIFKAPFPAKKL